MATPSQHVPLYALEDERHMLVRDVERIQVRLGRLKQRQRRRVARDGDAERLKNELMQMMQRLREINRRIKEERRRATTLLTEGSPRPRTAFQYMVALYRLFDAAIPDDQRSQDERALMRRARDFVMTGRSTGE